jgi:hypothetical protein
MEEWIPVKDYEIYYHVNSSGEVKSLKRVISEPRWGIRTYKEKIMKQGVVAGYPAIRASKDGESIILYVHRLVASAFIPNPENKPCVNHIDGNKLNNHKDNLEWCTHQENAQHAVKTGLIIPPRCAKLTKEEVCEIRESFENKVYIAKKYKVSRSTVSDIKNRKTWKHID